MYLAYDLVAVAGDRFVLILSMIGRWSGIRIDFMPASRVKAEVHA
jgi:hypothetical protein